jgi:hypothetical protein
MTPFEHLQQRAKNLDLYGLLAHCDELADSAWVEQLLTWEETEQAKRSLERRLGSAHTVPFLITKILEYSVFLHYLSALIFCVPSSLLTRFKDGHSFGKK